MGLKHYEKERKDIPKNGFIKEGKIIPNRKSQNFPDCDATGNVLWRPTKLIIIVIISEIKPII